MKRSRAISLVLMGIGASGLAACDSGEQIMVFNNPQQCVEQKQGTTSECLTKFDQARAAHRQTAPTYESKADCERDFGAAKCEDKPSSNPGGPRMSYIPFMAGYMMGQRASNVAPQPLYKFNGAADYRTPGGGSIPGTVNGSPIGPRTVPASAIAPASTAARVARGGFGSTALGAHASSAG